MVKWQGWPESQNTWEPKENLTNCKSQVLEYHRKHPGKRGPGPRGKGSNQRKGRKKRQPVTSPSQSMIRVAMVRVPGSPYPGQSSPRLALSHDPEDSKWRDLDQQRTALAPQPLGVRVRSEPAELLNAQLRDASPVSPAEPSPTLPQKQTGYTQPSPKYNQHSDLSRYPRNSEGSSLRSAYNGKPSLDPALLHGQHGRDAQESNSGGENGGKTEPWAWSGEVRKGKKRGYDTTGTPKPPPPPPD